MIAIPCVKNDTRRIYLCKGSTKGRKAKGSSGESNQASFILLLVWAFIKGTKGKDFPGREVSRCATLRSKGKKLSSKKFGEV